MTYHSGMAGAFRVVLRRSCHFLTSDVNGCQKIPNIGNPVESSELLV